MRCFDRMIVNLLTVSIAFLLPSTTHSFMIAPASIPCRTSTLINKFATSSSSSVHTDESRNALKTDLLGLLKETPSNAPTSRMLTRDILGKIDELEQSCPTPDDEVLQKLGGNWELLWTAQDMRSTEWKRNPFRSYINPLENQAYSNNPDGSGGQGRSNPFLPRRIQDRLERLGLKQGSARSSQLVELEKQRVRNIVTFQFPGRRQRQATLTIDIQFTPNDVDARRVDVKFHAARLIVPTTRIRASLPLGRLGPRGWLRTPYIDDTLRITRGHKGSVFVLSRAKAKQKNDASGGEADDKIQE